VADTNQPHQTLIREIDRLQRLAQEWTRLFPQAGSQEEHWLKVLSQVQAHVAEDLSRLAVVGTVKAGKSTLINALVGQDLLKRGAGILTAMITRVQPGAQARAVLRFKDWGEIQGEVQRALSLFPSTRLLQRSAPLDLKKAEDRELLGQLLAEAQAAELWSGNGLNQDYLLLKSYLDGFELLKDLLAQGGELTLTGEALARHRDLVTREATAVYLKDVLLTIPIPWLPAGVELGDCQGSDSPIPQHLAQVLAYLIKTDLVLYTISSRVGLRQADFQFLAELKRMGLGPHIRFVLNLDLGELRGLDEVRQLRERAAQELQALLPGPLLFAFSTLKLLLEQSLAQGHKLDAREEALLSVWRGDPQAAAFSDQEARRLEAALAEEVRRLQHRRLAGGSLSQVQMVARGLREQLELTQGLMGQDLTALKELEKRLTKRRQSLEATLNSLRQTLEGAGARLKKTLKDRINSQLDPYYGLGASLEDLIRNYEPNWDELLPPGTEAALSAALYRLFQEFQKSLAQFAAGEFNVQMLEFIRTQEDWLRGQLAQAWAPLLLALKEALSLYYGEIGAQGLPAAPPSLEIAEPERPAQLEVPLLNLQLDPGWSWAGQVWMRSGVGFLRRAWEAGKRRLGLGTPLDPRTQLIRDLAWALKTIKNWLQEEIKHQLVDYRERLKFQYFFPLVDQWRQSQEEGLNNNLKSLYADLEGVAGSLHLAEEERAARRRRLEEMLPQAKEIEARLGEGGQGSQTPAPFPKPHPPTP
jgi:hypothetical protein